MALEASSHQTSSHIEMLTVGVEEEFVLVDRDSRITVPRAAEVHESAAGRLGERVARELYATQIEAHTRPAKQAEELRADLLEGRRVLVAAAARADCLLVASGTAVLTSKPFAFTEADRYQEIAARFPAAAAGVDSEANGCHIHVGELEQGEAVVLAGHLRPWLPVVQALAVNSPFAAGAFRQVASWRHYQQQTWPTMGPTPLLPSDGYEQAAEELVGSGAVLDRKMIYWYARPSEQQPTLEIRVADVCADVDVALLCAVLTRALAMVLLQDVRAGVPVPRTHDLHLHEGHRQAADFGMSGAWRDPLSGRLLPLTTGLSVLIERAAPALEALDETPLVEELLTRVSRSGTGAQRQQATYRQRGRLQDVVDELAVLTARG